MMSTRPYLNRPRKNQGFALVVTLSLMILLTIIAVGLLSLSSVSLRNASSITARAEAQANARLALMLAIGELQKQMGPDQRITANGGIIPNSGNPVKHPHWTGVWNSWKAGDGTSFHRSIEGESLTGMAPTYLPGRNDYFRSWLLSLNPAEASQWDAPIGLAIDGQRMPEDDQDAVQLVSEGSLGQSAAATEFVSARLLDIQSANGGRGRYAWWVGDQTQKARVMHDSYNKESSLTLAQKIARPQAPAPPAPKHSKGWKQ